MSSLDNNVGCVSEVTLAISNERNPQANSSQVMDSPDSDVSGYSRSPIVQRFSYPSNSTMENNSEVNYATLPTDDLRIPIIGYEVMEERARFTVYKLRVEPRVRECWYIFRHHTDFVRLLNLLKSLKAPISHLSLPQKKWFGNNFAPLFLEHRTVGLQDFVNGIIKPSELVQIPCVREFFCLNEPPSLSDTVEESRAIFEALEDTICHLRQQLRERDLALAMESARCNEFRLKLQHLVSISQTCSKCGSPQQLASLD